MFEGYVIYLCGGFKLEQKADSENKKIKSSEESVQKLNSTVKGILLFCDKMPNKNPEEPTEILEW